VAGDYNADSILDLAVAHFGNSNISILLGNGSGGRGDGTFVSVASYSVGAYPNFVTTGDFNADSILDLAVPNGSNYVSIFLGNGSGGRGDGTFAPRVDYPVGGQPYSMIMGDFNDDRIVDLATANSASDTVSVFLGNGISGRGSGTFAARVDYAAGTAPSSLAIGDFNTDSIQDLVVANLDSNTVSMLLGNGGGSRGTGMFAAKMDFATGTTTESMASGDFNGDGIMDLVVVNWDMDYATVHLGNGISGRGDGTFAAGVDYSTGPYPIYVTTCDFNTDSILDLAVTNYDANTVSVLLGNGSNGRGNGTFAAKADYAVGNCPFQMTTGDFDADKIPDLAVSNYCSSNVSVLLGNGSSGRGDGTFAARVNYTVGVRPCSVTAGDFNDDGIQDLVTANYVSSDVSVLLGNGNGGKGDGTFSAKVDYAAGTGAYTVRTGDFNADKILDLAVTNYDVNSVSVLLGGGNSGRGNGTFAIAGDYGTGTAPIALTAVDFDADSILDLAVANPDSNSMSVFLGNGINGRGNGTFAARVDYATGLNPMELVTGDFNADSVLDLAVANNDSDSISVFLGMGVCQ
jgi:hypothetical protein